MSLLKFIGGVAVIGFILLVVFPNNPFIQPIQAIKLPKIEPLKQMESLQT